MKSMFTLEPYNGSNRYTCPNCGKSREFVRYVNENGDYLAERVGRCNRDSKCGYHYKPREFFADNPETKTYFSVAKNNSRNSLDESSIKEADYIHLNELLRTINNYDDNSFIEFLLQHFSADAVQEIAKNYCIGTWEDNRTVFWQIDAKRRIHTGKLMRYDAETGKRIKEYKPSWVHYELKRKGSLAENFSLEQCFFGEHLLIVQRNKAVGIVESEKTAVIASLCIPEFIWLATGGSTNLKSDKLQRFNHQRPIVLFPDSSKFEQWSATSEETKRKYGINIRVFNFLEKRLSCDEKKEDYDIADFLLKDAHNQLLKH